MKLRLDHSDGTGDENVHGHLINGLQREAVPIPDERPDNIGLSCPLSAQRPHEIKCDSV